jgi:hypothetical protein
LVLFANIKQGWKCLAVTKALAYNTVILPTAVNYPSEALVLFANIRQGWKCLAVTKALAYNTVVILTILPE